MVFGMGATNSTLGDGRDERVAARFVSPAHPAVPADAPSTSEPNPPPRELSGSLYDLWSPEKDHEVDVIFFHGLQPDDYKNAYWATWSSKPGDIWPRSMLSLKFPTARMLAVSYDAAAKQAADQGRFNLIEIAERLYADIIDTTGEKRVGERPVILVGHSLGGLVIKQFLMYARERMQGMNPDRFKLEIKKTEQFFGNLKGIFYYATPHGGSPLANVAAKLPSAGAVLDVLKAFNAETQRLNGEFERWRQQYYVPTYSLYEMHATPIPGFGGDIVLVPEASARRDSDKFYPARANHITICKPQNMTAGTFQKLEEFILEKSTVTNYTENPQLLEATTEYSTDLT